MVNQLFLVVFTLFRPLWLFPTIIGRWFPHSKLFWNATADMLQLEKRLLICNLLVSMFPAIRDAICFHNFNNWPFRASKSNTFRTFVADGQLTKLGVILSSLDLRRNKRLSWTVNEISAPQAPFFCFSLQKCKFIYCNVMQISRRNCLQVVFFLSITLFTQRANMSKPPKPPDKLSKIRNIGQKYFCPI